MIQYRSRMNGSTISGVNITPFTDVVLVLLIVFMISAPGILNSVLHIQLPRSGSTEKSRKEPATIGVDAKGNLFWNGNPVEKPELTDRVKERLERDPQFSFTINADSRTPHGSVVDVLDILRQEGASKISVGTVRQ